MTQILMYWFFVGFTLPFTCQDSGVSSRLWRTNATGQEFWQRNNFYVYYDVSPYLPHKIGDLIYEQIIHFNSLTCVKWIPLYPWPGQEFVQYKVTFTHVPGWAQQCKFITRQNHKESNERIIEIGATCHEWLTESMDVKRFRTVLMYNMMRAMGLYNEHQRINRDCYITLSDDLSKEINFQKLPEHEFFSDFPYDYESIMHYPSWLVKGMGAHLPNITKLGRDDGSLSPLDILKLEMMSCEGPSYCQSEDAGPVLEDGWRKNCKETMERESGAGYPGCQPNVFTKPPKYEHTGPSEPYIPVLHQGPWGVCKKKP